MDTAVVLFVAIVGAVAADAVIVVRVKVSMNNRGNVYFTA